MYKLRESKTNNLEICDMNLKNVFNLDDIIKENGAIKTYNQLNIKEAFNPIVVNRTLYNNFDNFSKLYNNLEKDKDKNNLNEIYLYKIFDIISYNYTNVALMKPTFDLIKKNVDNYKIIDSFKDYFDGKDNKHGLGSGFGNGLLYITILSIESNKEKAFEFYKEIFNYCDFKYKEEFNLSYFLDIDTFGDLNRKIKNEIYESEKKLIFTINGVQQIIDINDKSKDDISKIKKLIENIKEEKKYDNLLYKVDKFNEVFNFDFKIPKENIYSIGGGVSEIIKIKENIKFSDINNIIEDFNKEKNLNEFNNLINR